MDSVIFWFRRDLRLTDNCGLNAALLSGKPVICIYIFDENNLHGTGLNDDPRKLFIEQELIHLQSELKLRNSNLLIFKGNIPLIFESLIDTYTIKSVFCNEEYEPYTHIRDSEIQKLLLSKGINFELFSDSVIFHPGRILKSDNTPYTVFTPYSKKWLSTYHSERNIYLNEANENYHCHLLENHNYAYSLHKKALAPKLFPSKRINETLISEYALKREIPFLNATSRLGIHLRYGTISIRNLVQIASKNSQSLLNELIWREFYFQILYHFPKVIQKSFKEKYEQIEWDNNPVLFEKWKAGISGIPIVDAGMRELNSTGFMHNRVRMITASFLVKNLLIDWRWGEAYFAEKLLDFELANNNGGWQWTAGCGTDAAPYFRIFNPIKQTERYDKELNYIRKWIPEFGTPEYPSPIIDLKVSVKRCIDVYKKAII